MIGVDNHCGEGGGQRPSLQLSLLGTIPVDITQPCLANILPKFPTSGPQADGSDDRKFKL